MSIKVIRHNIPPRKVRSIQKIIAERDQIVCGLKRIRETATGKDRNALDKAIGFIENYDAINNIVGEMEGVTVDSYLDDAAEHGVTWEETIYTPPAREEAERQRMELEEHMKQRQERFKAYMMQLAKNAKD